MGLSEKYAKSSTSGGRSASTCSFMVYTLASGVQSIEFDRAAAAAASAMADCAISEASLCSFMGHAHARGHSHDAPCLLPLLVAVFPLPSAVALLKTAWSSNVLGPPLPSLPSLPSPLLLLRTLLSNASGCPWPFICPVCEIERALGRTRAAKRPLPVGGILPAKSPRPMYLPCLSYENRPRIECSTIEELERPVKISGFDRPRWLKGEKTRTQASEKTRRRYRIDS
mmetsp:Transcript_3876/g.11105  ORF Transcript_3876/g.11105 Transcript_3876/m.11105 type:complete len:227 (+) Transcript_3876:224-904(+)